MTSPPPHIKGGSPGNTPGAHRSRSAAARGSRAQTESSPECRAQPPIRVRPPRVREVQSLSPSIQSARSRTCYARSDTSTRGNSSPTEKTKTLSEPSRRFPAPSLRLLRDSVSASERSCTTDRRAAWPVLRTNRVEAPLLTRLHSKTSQARIYSRHKNNLFRVIRCSLGERQDKHRSHGDHFS